MTEDVWPAVLEEDGGARPEARLHIFPDTARTMLWVEQGSQLGPTILLDTYGPVEFSRPSADLVIVDAGDQGTYVVRKTSGCGCGSRLKALSPDAGLARVAAMEMV